MSSQDDLLAAIKARSSSGVVAAGWGDVFTLLDSWPGTLGWDKMVPYALILGERDPLEVHRALVAYAAAGRAEWRPVAGQLAAAMGGPAFTARTVRPSLGLGPLELATVARLHESGQPECGCPPARNFKIDGRGVERCQDCGGLDWGQVTMGLAA